MRIASVMSLCLLSALLSWLTLRWNCRPLQAKGEGKVAEVKGAGDGASFSVVSECPLLVSGGGGGGREFLPCAAPLLLEELLDDLI